MVAKKHRTCDKTEERRHACHLLARVFVKKRAVLSICLCSSSIFSLSSTTYSNGTSSLADVTQREKEKGCTSTHFHALPWPLRSQAPFWGCNNNKNGRRSNPIACTQHSRPQLRDELAQAWTGCLPLSLALFLYYWSTTALSLFSRVRVERGPHVKFIFHCPGTNEIASEHESDSVELVTFQM